MLKFLEKYPLYMDTSPSFGLDVWSELEKKNHAEVGREISFQHESNSVLRAKCLKWIRRRKFMPRSGGKYFPNMDPATPFGVDVWNEFKSCRETERNFSPTWIQFRTRCLKRILKKNIMSTSEEKHQLDMDPTSGYARCLKWIHKKNHAERRGEISARHGSNLELR